MSIGISLNKLRIGYGNDCRFPEISASTENPELIVLLGRNGAGKSTLLRTIAGLQNPISGETKLGGRNINAYSTSEKAALISYVSTERFRVANLTVFDLVSMGRYSYTNWLGSLDDDDRRAISESLKMAGVEHLTHKTIDKISDGELQRVMIAGTLAQNTPLIILDEPAAFLDFPNKFDILLLLRNLAWNEGKTVIISSHDLDIAMRFADNIWLLTNDGFLQGAPEDFAMNHGFERIFENTGVSFNYDSGTIDTGIAPKNNITLICSNPKVEFWLQKAVNRMGFKNIQNAGLTVEVRENKFMLRTNGIEKIFSDIYGLCRELANCQINCVNLQNENIKRINENT